jgi:hypothetical protein
MNPLSAIAASLAIQEAETQIHRAILEEILQRTGIQEIEGKPIPAWIEARRTIELEKVLLAMGDRDPAAYAVVKACIDEAVRKARSV